MSNEPASISKSDMKAALAKMMARYRLAAPVSNGKVTDFLVASDVDQILLDDGVSYKSPKEFFFPRCEKILSFGPEGATPGEPGQPTILFGVRPCDLEALAVMTRVFATGKFEDPFFLRRMEQNLLIGVGCQAKKPGCFCDQLAVDMGDSRACDLFLKDQGDRYEVRYVSEKGKELLSEYLPVLSSFANSEAPAKSAQTLSISGSEAELFERINWEAIAETCQGCGLCTYICPTCHCFDFKDVEENGAACRYRNWDSCMFPKFTLHASGHNPRDSKKERYRQRVLHKYLYIPQNFGATACTGCGRCIRSCPAGVNIRQVVEGIMEELK